MIAIDPGMIDDSPGPRPEAAAGFPYVIVGGVPIAVASRAELTAAMVAACLARRASGGGRSQLVFDANAHGLSLNDTDPAYRAALSQADIVHADGGSIVLASRLLTKQPIPERSATTDMIHDLAAAAAQNGLSFYLLGGTEEVNAACAAKLTEIYPALRIAGRRHGYFTASDEEQIVADIAAARPDVLWVGLGKPAEQQFAARHATALNAGWVVTCGGCFNYVTGHYKRAPTWMQRAHLEWVHRALTGPRHLIWRYLVTTPHAAWLAVVTAKRAKTNAT